MRPRIHASTEGNSLFMADLVTYLCDCGVIAQVDSRWSLKRAPCRMSNANCRSRPQHDREKNRTTSMDLLATWHPRLPFRGWSLTPPLLPELSRPILRR